MKVVLGIIVIAVVVVVGIFAGYNYNTYTTVNMIGSTWENVSLALIVFIGFVFGLFSVIIFAIVEGIALRSRISRFRKETEALKKEINALRNLPLASDILEKQTSESEE